MGSCLLSLAFNSPFPHEVQALGVGLKGFSVEGFGVQGLRVVRFTPSSPRFTHSRSGTTLGTAIFCSMLQAQEDAKLVAQGGSRHSKPNNEGFSQQMEVSEN